MEDKKYCIYCGAENNASDETCVQCQKELHPTESLLKEFLVERVKDELKGNLEDTLYDAVKNFLLSHFYGAILTVSIVSYAVVATGTDILADNRKKHIIHVNRPIVNIEEIQIEENDQPVNVLTQEEEINSLISEYVIAFKDYDQNRAMIQSMEASKSSYATNLKFNEGNIAGYSDSIMVFGENIEIDSSNPIGPIARGLKDAGKNYAQTFVNIVDANNDLAVNYYLFTLVKDNGEWRVAETVSGINMMIDPTEQGARGRMDAYRNGGKFKDYEAYTNAEYQSFISNRLPSSYGYATSYEFDIYRFLPQANGCLDFRVESSGMSPASARSNLGSTLRSQNIPFVEYTLSEDIYGNEGYMGTQSWLIVVGYFDGIWYVVEDKYLGVSQYENAIQF